MNIRLHILWIVTLLISPTAAFSDDLIWTGAVDNEFLNAANWDGGVPNNDEALAVIDGGENQPVVIPESAEMITLGGFQLGTSGENGGHVIQNGGTLIVAPLGLDGVPTEFEFKSHIGDSSSLDSSWIMNNDATILYDAPLEGDGFGLDSDGENGFDLEIGAATGDAVGRLELHDNAVLRISDDLKIGAEDNGNGRVLVDGNAVASMGSGISVGESETGKGILEIRGNALVVSGNSAGPGQSEVGLTNEGYMTLSQSNVTVSDSAKLYVRTFQHRSGVANVTLDGSGQFHVFDVFQFEGPDLGNSTLTANVNGPQRTSHIGGNADGDITITIKDDAVMTVDSDLEDSPWNGLALSGGTNRGANAPGGVTLIEVRDRGNFTVQQDLHMTLGNADTAESTLKIVGSDAQVAINGNLYMALDIEGIENVGTATLHSVITGSSHSTISVGGVADIFNGSLNVELDGFSPRGGEVYTLLQADSIMGEAFLDTDFSMAELPDGLGWDLAIVDMTSIVLSVTGQLEDLLGDFDSMNGLDINDIDALVSHIEADGNDLGFDVNGDASITKDDIDVWLGLKSEAAGTPIVGGDSDLDGSVAFDDFLILSANFGDASTTWSQGNYDGVDGTAFDDFLVLSANFGTAPAAAESVPQPTTACFLIAISLVGMRIRRSRVVC